MKVDTPLIYQVGVLIIAEFMLLFHINFAGTVTVQRNLLPQTLINGCTEVSCCESCCRAAEDKYTFDFNLANRCLPECTRPTNCNAIDNKRNRDSCLAAQQFKSNSTFSFSVDGSLSCCSASGQLHQFPELEGAQVCGPPTEAPTETPTISPSVSPSVIPTISPSDIPTVSPTYSPSTAPTIKPTDFPTKNPTITLPGVTAAPTISRSLPPVAEENNSLTFLVVGIGIATLVIVILIGYLFSKNRKLFLGNQSQVSISTSENSKL